MTASCSARAGPLIGGILLSPHLGQGDGTHLVLWCWRWVPRESLDPCQDGCPGAFSFVSGSSDPVDDQRPLSAMYVELY